MSGSDRLGARSDDALRRAVRQQRAAERPSACRCGSIRGRGRFGRQVAAGAVDQAREDELETVERRTGDGPLFDDVPEVWDLFSTGRFEDDVAIVKEARSAPHPPRTICSVAAGVQDFASEVEDVDGIYGIAQWFPGADERARAGAA